MTKFLVPNGLEQLAEEIPMILQVIARTARWVHPDTFRALPLWYPEAARKGQMYKACWENILVNKGAPKKEANQSARRAFYSALGTAKRKTGDWTVCHIWGIDDPRYQKKNDIVQDRRYYSCVGNMVWLPTPLKGFTDVVPGIKLALRTCAYHLYDWLPDHKDAETVRQVKAIRSGTIPDDYPKSWPSAERQVLPPNTAPYSPIVQENVKKRKKQLRAMLDSPVHKDFPRDAVREVLTFWNIEV